VVCCAVVCSASTVEITDESKTPATPSVCGINSDDHYECEAVSLLQVEAHVTIRANAELNITAVKADPAPAKLNDTAVKKAEFWNNESLPPKHTASSDNPVSGHQGSAQELNSTVVKEVDPAAMALARNNESLQQEHLSVYPVSALHTPGVQRIGDQGTRRAKLGRYPVNKTDHMPGVPPHGDQVTQPAQLRSGGSVGRFRTLFMVSSTGYGPMAWFLMLPKLPWMVLIVVAIIASFMFALQGGGCFRGSFLLSVMSRLGFVLSFLLWFMCASKILRKMGVTLADDNLAGYVLQWCVLFLGLPEFFAVAVMSIANPPSVTPALPPWKETLSSFLKARSRLVVRFVTRGDNAELVRQRVSSCARILFDFDGLPRERWHIEVVTERPLPGVVESYSKNVSEIVVPAAYQTPKGSLFKGRNLVYASANSNAQATDWILHFDEETLLTAQGAQAFLHHVGTQERLVATGRTRFPAIGHAARSYAQLDVTSLLCCLCNSGIVWQDWVIRRFQYNFNLPVMIISNHGSGVLIRDDVEKSASMDHGPDASLAEDLVCWGLVPKQHGVGAVFIPWPVHELSPFSLGDLYRQRRRWYAGSMAIVKVPAINMCSRVFYTIFWTSGLLKLFMIMCSVAVGSRSLVAMKVFTLAVAIAWSYLVGMFLNFNVQRWGFIGGLMLALLQIASSPLCILIEFTTLLSHIICPMQKYTFDVVAKEHA